MIKTLVVVAALIPGFAVTLLRSRPRLRRPPPHHPLRHLPPHHPLRHHPLRRHAAPTAPAQTP